MRKFLYWLLAVVITIALSVFQRMTGPTHPQKVAVELNGTSYQQKLPRSGVQRDEVLKLKDILKQYMTICKKGCHYLLYFLFLTKYYLIYLFKHLMRLFVKFQQNKNSFQTSVL